MTWLSRLLLTTSVVEAAVAVIAFVYGGPRALVAALVGTTVALTAQLVAIMMLRPGMAAPGAEFVKRWAGGIGARAASFVIIAVLIVALKDVLPPLWMAVGYLALLLTLLFAETKFLT